MILTGVLFGLSFPPFNFSILVFVAFTSMLIAFDNCNSYKEVFTRMYVIFFSFELVTVSWISLSGLRDGADTFMIFGGLVTMILHTLYFVFTLMALFFLRKNLKIKSMPYLYLLFVPFIWTTHEYLQIFGQLNFPWTILSYTHSSALSKIQYIELTGMFAISIWITSLSCLLFYIIKKIRDGEWTIKRFKIAGLILLLVAGYFTPDAYTFFSGSKERYTNKVNEGTINIGIVQPNINPWKKWGAKQDELIAQYLQMSSEVINSNPTVELIILPETALPFHFTWDVHNEKYLVVKNYVDSTGVPMLIGAPDLKFYKDPELAPSDAKEFSNGQKFDTFNSAIFVEPGKDKSEYTIHDKNKLVAASERMPYQEKFPFLQNLIKWSVGLSSFQMGQDTVLFDMPGSETKFHVAICYESVYPDFFADYVNRGADFSIIITNDGWWGKLFGTYQHNQYAILRAIENRRWIARCANTGISCFIDQYGNLFDKTEINEKKIINRKIGLSSEKTFYTKHGDLIADYSAYLSGVLMILGVILKLKRKFT